MAIQYIAAKEFQYGGKRYGICERVPNAIVDSRLKKLGLVVKSSEMDTLVDGESSIDSFAELLTAFEELKIRVIKLESENDDIKEILAEFDEVE